MKFIIGDNQDVVRLSNFLCKHKKPVDVTTKPHRSSRSLEQNSLLHVWIDAVRLHYGDASGQHYSKQEWKDFFAKKFLSSRVIEVNGEKIRVVEATSDLDVEKFSLYLDRIAEYCRDKLNLVLDTRHA